MLLADWALVPGGQGRHTEAVESAAVPAEHTAQLELEALETLPGVQGVHDVAEAKLKVPAEQMLHDVPLRNMPAAQDVMLAPLSIV